MPSTDRDPAPVPQAPAPAPTPTPSLTRRRLVGRGAALAGGLAAMGVSRPGLAAPAIRTAQTDAAAQVSGTLRMTYLGTADQAVYWNKLFALFQERYPNVELIAEANPVDNWAAYFDAVSTQIAGGNIPDLVQVATEGQRLFTSRGLVVPIDDLMERDKDELAEFFDDMHPNLIEWYKTYSSPDGQTYYLPTGEFNTMAIWANMEVLANAGVAEPTDDWTWDDFLAAGQAVKAAGSYGMIVSPEYFVGIMPWLLTNGASTLDPTWTTATVNSPEAIEAATFMRSLVEQEISPAPGGAFDRFTALAQGELAMLGGGRWPVINIRQLGVVDKVKIFAWPQKTMLGSPVGWNGYAMMKGTENREAAWAFVKFCGSVEASTYFAVEGGTIVPGRRSVAESDAFLDNAPAGMEKLYAALDYATPIPSPDKGSIVQREIEDTFGQILIGNVDPTEALNDLNETITENL